MNRTLITATMFTALLALAWPAAAQDTSNGTGPADTAAVAPDSDGSSTAAAAPDLEAWKRGRPIVMQYYRPLDSRGVNIFETSKFPGAPYSDFKFDIGAAFASEMQNLTHSNTATPMMVSGVNANQLANIGFGRGGSGQEMLLRKLQFKVPRLAGDRCSGLKLVELR